KGHGLELEWTHDAAQGELGVQLGTPERFPTSVRVTRQVLRLPNQPAIRVSHDGVPVTERGTVLTGNDGPSATETLWTWIAKRAVSDASWAQRYGSMWAIRDDIRTYHAFCQRFDNAAVRAPVQADPSITRFDDRGVQLERPPRL